MFLCFSKMNIMKSVTLKFCVKYLFGLWYVHLWNFALEKLILHTPFQVHRLQWIWLFTNEEEIIPQCWFYWWLFNLMPTMFLFLFEWLGTFMYKLRTHRSCEAFTWVLARDLYLVKPEEIYFTNKQYYSRPTQLIPVITPADIYTYWLWLYSYLTLLETIIIDNQSSHSGIHLISYPFIENAA